MTSKELSNFALLKALRGICALCRQPFIADMPRAADVSENAILIPIPHARSAYKSDRTIHRSMGFTMVEVLVSVFVLAVGVIGTAGMQLTALRTAQQSTFQTTALQLASEMAEKMRINDRQMKLADNANLFLKVDYQSAAGTDLTGPEVLCYEVNCTAEDLARFDIYELKTRIKALPGGRVRICRDAHPWDSAAGAFKWTCNAPATNANNAPLVIKIGWEGKGNSPDGRAVKEAAKQFPPSVAITLEPYAK